MGVPRAGELDLSLSRYSNPALVLGPAPHQANTVELALKVQVWVNQQEQEN